MSTIKNLKIKINADIDGAAQAEALRKLNKAIEMAFIDFKAAIRDTIKIKIGDPETENEQ